MSDPEQPPHEANSQNHVNFSSRSLLDGVVVFPDGSVMWVPDSSKQSSTVKTSDNTLESAVLPYSSTSTGFLPAQPQPCYLYCYRPPLESGVTSRLLAVSLGVAIALILLFPIAYVLPIWAYEWRFGNSLPSVSDCLDKD